MKQETLKWVKDAYKTEADCITEMLNHLDEEQFSKAIEQNGIPDNLKDIIGGAH